MIRSRLYLINNSAHTTKRRTGYYNFPQLINGEIKQLTLGNIKHYCREIVFNRTVDRINPSSVGNRIILENTDCKLFFETTFFPPSIIRYGEIDSWYQIKDKEDLKFFEDLLSKILFNNSPVTIKRSKIGLKFKIQCNLESYSVSGLTWKLSLALLILRHPVLFMNDLLTLKDDEDYLEKINNPEFHREIKERLIDKMINSIDSRILPGINSIDGYSTGSYGVSYEGILLTATGLLFGEDFVDLYNTGIASHGWKIKRKSYWDSILELPSVKKSEFFQTEVFKLKKIS
jgi:hypothetical protein